MIKTNLLILWAYSLLFILQSCAQKENELFNRTVSVTMIPEYDLEVCSEKSIPDFPFALLVDTIDYTIRVENEHQEEISTWQQDLNEMFQFQAMGDVHLSARKPTSFSHFPLAHYTLEGNKGIAFQETETTIPMINNDYAAIAIYNEFVKEVSINDCSTLPVVDTNTGIHYSYSFVDPNDAYSVTLVDSRNNRYTINIAASDLDANDLVRIYLTGREVNGHFEIIVDWEDDEYNFIVKPPVEFDLNPNLETVVMEDKEDWSEENGNLVTRKKGATVSINFEEKRGCTYNEVFDFTFFSVPYLSKVTYVGSFKQFPFDYFEGRFDNRNTVAIYAIEKDGQDTRFRRLLGRSRYGLPIVSVNEPLTWFFEADNGNYYEIFNASGRMNSRIRNNKVFGIAVENMFENGIKSTIYSFRLSQE